MNMTRIAFCTAVCIFVSAGAMAQNPLYLDESAPVPERVQDLLDRLTVEEKIDLLVESAPAIPRLGIDKYYHGNEALHGIIRPGKFTVFPQAIAFAASWDPELLRKVSGAISDEARGRWNELREGKDQHALYTDLLTFWSPTMNMARDPRWGRTPETYGEDPFLTGTMGTAFVKGLQGDDPRYLKVVSTPKHFAANNVEDGRMSAVAMISEKDLREYYLPGYEMAVKEAHPASMMASYTAINGIPSSCNPWLLNKVLRDDWGFDGYVVSDCGGAANVVSPHHYVKTPETAATLCIKAGLDLECGFNIYREPLLNAYRLGMVSDEDIDRSARRILTARMRLGLFDSGKDNPYTRISPDIVGCPEHQELALQMARESMVLLKNNGILPLNSKKLRKVSVVGFSADKCLYGHYSGHPLNDPVSPLQGIKARLSDKVEIYSVPWKNLKDLYQPMTPEGGFKAEYFNGKSLEGKPAVRTENCINYDPANQAPDPFLPKSPMSARWTADFTAPTGGEYSFLFSSDDGCRIYLDDVLVVDDWTSHGEKNQEFSSEFSAGSKHSLTVEYFDQGSACVARLGWRIPVDEEARMFNSYGSEMAEEIKNSDVVIAVMGIDTTVESEGQDRKSLNLPADQEKFLQDLYSVNKNIVLVLESGSPFAINWEQDNLPGIIMAWYPGEQGGNALAEILFGDCNPSGKLPFTFYKSTDDLPAMDDYDISKRTYKYFDKEVLYPFGFGLSYTKFEISNLTVSDAGDTWDVAVDVRNKGRRSGDEVVQIYARLPEYEGKAPFKELKGFRRVTLRPSEKQTVHIPVRKCDLRYWSETRGCFVYPEGQPEFFAGNSSVIGNK